VHYGLIGHETGVCTGTAAQGKGWWWNLIKVWRHVLDIISQRVASWSGFKFSIGGWSYRFMPFDYVCWCD